MANGELTSCLPPIIEDESDENVLPLLYQKELERKGYGKSSPLNSKDNSESTNGSPLPYNSWKVKNGIQNRSIENGISPDMVSRLGQSLEHCHSVVSNQEQNGFGTTKSPNNMHGCERVNYNSPGIHATTEPTFANLSCNKYSHPRQDIPDSHHISDPGVTTPRIYNRGAGRYSDYKHNGSRSQIIPNENPPIQMQSTVHSPNDFSNVSRVPFNVYPSNITYNSPPFRPGFDSEKFQHFSSYQNCCQGNLTNQNAYLSNNMVSHETSHLTHGNSNYHENVIPYHQQPGLQPQTAYQCYHNSEYKQSKKDKKREKNRAKQINDLYRIVWLQNQQLIQLQNEVKKLIEYNVKNEDKNHKSADLEQTTKKQCKSTMEKRMFNLQVIEENKNLMEKVSVGIMTSFVDTTSVKRKGKKKDVEVKRFETSSESGTSSSSDSSSSEEKDRENIVTKKRAANKKNKSGKPIDDSIGLHAIDIKGFTEDIPSPTGSLHINMQDYASSSSASDTSISGNDNSTPVPVGWTFYDKVVGKVNNILKESESDDSENEIHNQTLNQLRKLGIGMEDSPSSKRVTFDEAGYVPHQQKLFLGESDTSMKMNALALKYLQEGETPSKGFEKDSPSKRGMNNTNLSLATLRYLEKYHLIPRVAQGYPEAKVEKSKKKKDKKKEEKRTHKKRSKSSDPGKILDITAIKQQPKLLPKKQ